VKLRGRSGDGEGGGAFLKTQKGRGGADVTPGLGGGAQGRSGGRLRAANRRGNRHVFPAGGGWGWGGGGGVRPQRGDGPPAGKRTSGTDSGGGWTSSAGGGGGYSAIGLEGVLVSRAEKKKKKKWGRPLGGGGGGARGWGRVKTGGERGSFGEVRGGNMGPGGLLPWQGAGGGNPWGSAR